MDYVFCKSNVTNIASRYCTTIEEIFSSVILYDLLFKHISKYENNIEMKDYLEIDQKDIKDIVAFLIHDFKKIINENDLGYYSNKDKNYFKIFFIDILDCWAKIQKYGLIFSKENNVLNLIDRSNKLNNLILEIKTIIYKKLGYYEVVYNKECFGLTVTFGLTTNQNHYLNLHYPKLSQIPLIETLYFETPIVFYSNSNKRKGEFQELKENQLKNLFFDVQNWIVLSLKIGELIAYIYCHKDFISLGVASTNLFKVVEKADYDKKPDIILIYGHPDKELIEGFYFDETEQISYGFLSHSQKIEYFGYMKKMLLTLHNIHMINHGYLPIHGSMSAITFKNNQKANIVIIGDSGAGKSETLEAFRKIANEYIKDIDIIFDDMGTFKIENNELRAYGTEIGAFVRLDDLEFQVAFRNINKAIFLNPTNVNSRMLLPVSSYDIITKGYPVDYVLYANNFTANRSLYFFKDYQTALETFKQGTRMAKGTTSEMGLVTSYFANPFGPSQKREKCDILLDKYFQFLFDKDIKVGEMFTLLSIPSLEKEGPLKAARSLFDEITSK